jgi:hypothetical protein
MAGNAFDHNGEIFLGGGVGVSLGTVRISLKGRRGKGRKRRVREKRVKARVRRRSGRR